MVYDYIHVYIHKNKVAILPSHLLLCFLASIYLDPGFEPLISHRCPKVLSIRPPRWLYIHECNHIPFYRPLHVHVYERRDTPNILAMQTNSL